MVKVRLFSLGQLRSWASMLNETCRGGHDGHFALIPYGNFPAADAYRVSNLEARAGLKAWDDFSTLARGVKGEIQLIWYSQKLQLNFRADFLPNAT